MNSSIDSFDDHQHTSSRTKLRLRPFMRSSLMLGMAFVGCFYFSTMPGAVAFPRIPILPADATVSSVSTLFQHIYYYRGRYYPYRYHGAYYGHRYYRYGRWHYY